MNILIFIYTDIDSDRKAMAMTQSRKTEDLDVGVLV
jgi:hypothetical protein